MLCYRIICILVTHLKSISEIRQNMVSIKSNIIMRRKIEGVYIPRKFILLQLPSFQKRAF